MVSYAHSHEQVSAKLADSALERLRYPTDLRQRVVRIVRAHMLDPGRADEVRARRLLQRHGVGLTFDLSNDENKAERAKVTGNEQRYMQMLPRLDRLAEELAAEDGERGA